MTNKGKIDPRDLPSAWDTFERVFGKQTKWQKFKSWFLYDIPYEIDQVWYKLTGKWLLK